MAEYIERERIAELIRGSRYPEITKHSMMLILQSIPAADVEPVVRCRDCKHWMEAALTCNHPDLKFRIEKYFTRDCFCSFGEQKRSVTGHE